MAKEALAVVVVAGGVGLMTSAICVPLGLLEEAEFEGNAFRWFKKDMQKSTTLRTVLFPLLLSATALFVQTRSTSDPVALLAVAMTAVTGLLLLAPPMAMCVAYYEESLDRAFLAVYVLLELAELVGAAAAVTLIWVTHPEHDEDSKLDLAALGLFLAFAVSYIIASCAFYAYLLAGSDSDLKEYGCRLFRLFGSTMHAQNLWTDAASSPVLVVLLQPVVWFLLTFAQTIVALSESIEEPDECQTGRWVLFVDFAAGAVAVGLLCMGVTTETMKWKAGMIATTTVSLLFTAAFLGFKCFVLWLYGYMTCEGRFHFDIRNVVLANEFFYFAWLFVYVVVISRDFAENGVSDWWAKFGVHAAYFENRIVCTAVKKVTEHTFLWALFHAVVVSWEVIAMAKCGADGIDPETLPYRSVEHTPGGGCKDVVWYPMSVMFSVATTLLLLWNSFAARLTKPAILFNSGTTLHYYFISDLIIHITIMGNLAIAIGTLVVEPENRGWGITFTATNTFRLVMVIIGVLAELATFQERHQSLADALIEHMTYTDSAANPAPPTPGDVEAATVYVPPNIMDDFLNYNFHSENERTSEELRKDELRQRVFQKAKKGGQWVRRLRSDGNVVWVAVEDLRGESPRSSAGADGRPNPDGGSSTLSARRTSEHKSSSETDSAIDLSVVIPIVKTSSLPPEQEMSAKLGSFFCVVEPDGVIMWHPGEKLHTLKNVTEGLPRDITSAHLAAAATLPFEDKCIWVRARLDSLRIPWEQGHQHLYVDRANLLPGSVSAMNAIPSSRMRQIFRFNFEGEQGLDSGGVAREWFECVARELFDPALGLFMFASTDNVTYQIDPRAVARLGKDRCKELYYFTGRVMGKALFDNHLLSAHLVRPLYKHLLGIPVGFLDMQFVDDQLYDNMSWMMTEKNVDQLELTFTTVELGPDDQPLELELVTGGMDKVVTDDNKLDYIRACIKHRMLTRQEFALGHMLRGFFDVVPQGLLCVFDAQELELMMCGFDEIDVNDWKNNTSYEGAFSVHHKVIQWFWEILAQLSSQQRTRLLQYVTGTSRVPIGGFRQLQGVDGQVRRFTIRSLQLREHEYPRSHTCFNRLDLPVYSSKAHLESVLQQLTTVEIEGFSMD